MTKIQVFLFSTLLISTNVYANSAGLKLSGVVPLKAKVQVHTNQASPRVENLSSKELKFEISSRTPASFVTVSAP